MANYSRMAMEVNKLIAKELLSNKPVFLPQLGSLFITLDVSSRTRIEFTPNKQMGESIVNIICSCASCTDSQAQDIYRRWLEEVKSESVSVINIEGVGSIRANIFMTTESFALRLNPVKESSESKSSAPTKKVSSKPVNSNKPQQPKKEEEKKNRAILPIAISSVLLLLVGYFVMTGSKDNDQPKAKVEITEVISQDTTESNVIAVDSVKEHNVVTEPTNIAEQKLRFKVVYGVFSTRENAERAISEIKQKNIESISDIYTYGDKFLVSLYESAERSECSDFVNTHQNDMPGIWIYERKY